MAYIYLQEPQPPIQQGDLLLRPKDPGLGWHFGTGLSNGLAKDTMPETGKRITTWEGFCDGKQGFIVRPERSDLENAFVEARALSNLAGGYDPFADNCEHDSNFAQTGVATSPTVNFWGGLAVGGLLLLGVAKAMERKPKRRRRRR
jgi:hypothetical protein